MHDGDEGFASEAIYRSAVEEDYPFIFDAWIRTHYERGSHVKSVPRRVYETHHRLTIQKLMERGQILVACDPLEAGLIYGWIVFEAIGAQLCVHYCYVRSSQRRYGLGRRLFQASKAICHDEDLPVIVSHMSPSWQRLDQSSIYVPYSVDESHHNLIVAQALKRLLGSDLRRRHAEYQQASY